MTALFLDPLMHNALIAGLLIATTFSILGIFVILRQVVFIGIAMAQAASAGVAFSLLMGVVSISLFSSIASILPFGAGQIIWPALFTIVSVLVISMISQSRKLPPDASIGIIFSMLWALAIMFVANSGQGIAKVRNLIEGDLLMVFGNDVLIIGVLGVTVLSVLLLFWKHHLLVSFDEDMARALGYRTRFWTYSFFVLLGVAIVISIPYAGLLAIFTWMVIPPSIGLAMGKSITSASVISVVTAIVSTIAGLSMSLYWDLPPSPLINLSCISIAIFLGGGTKIISLLKVPG